MISKQPQIDLVEISIEDATQLGSKALQKIGYSSDDAAKIIDHLIDCELRGYGIAGLARILSLSDYSAGRKIVSDIKITQDLPAAAQLDGQDTLGYLTALKATELAIQKAKQTGVAVVGANNTWYTGMLSYYAELVAAQDLVTIIASNCGPVVAPDGTYKPLLGTNPFCIAFPSDDKPIIYDIGTSKITHAQTVLTKRLGQELPEDTAYSKTGEVTRNPWEALEGALTVWGGAKGSGLAIAVQLLGVLAGSPAIPGYVDSFGFLVIAINPAIFRPMEEFKREVGKLREAVHSAPALPGKPTLRMPFERSEKVRAQARDAGCFVVAEEIVDKLKKLVES